METLQTKDFIEQLNKELGITLTLVQNKNYPELGNVFYNNGEICPVPFNTINETLIPTYTIDLGGKTVPHPGMDSVKSKVITFIDRWNNEDGFKELMTEKF